MKREKLKDGVQALKVFGSRFEPLLDAFFKDAEKKISRQLPVTERMLRQIRMFCFSGGKRLRPALVFYGYSLFKKPGSAVLRASVATELIHTFLLIHDDIMDQSSLRRGKPAMHIRYEHASRFINPLLRRRRFGESMAILAGDLSYLLAINALNDLPVSSKIKSRLIALVNEATNSTIAGQALDLELEAKRRAPFSEIISMYRLKTACYSFEMPLLMGAVLAGAREKEIAALSRYAIPLGVAFQITDDILGAVGNERKTGKSAIDDLRQGKQTILLALARRDRTGEKAVAAIFKKRRLATGDVHRLRRLFSKTGVIKTALDRARTETARAKRALDFFKSRPRRYQKNALLFLEKLADFTTERTV